MCTEKHGLAEKVFTNGLNIGLPLCARVETTGHRIETHQLSGKENIPGAPVSKEGDVVWILWN